MEGQAKQLKCMRSGHLRNEFEIYINSDLLVDIKNSTKLNKIFIPPIYPIFIKQVNNFLRYQINLKYFCSFIKSAKINIKTNILYLYFQMKPSKRLYYFWFINLKHIKEK